MKNFKISHPVLMCALFLLFGYGVPVHALLIDKNTYATDTATGLDWLDVTATRGMSYASIINNPQYNGYRFATRAELDKLVTAYTGIDLSYSYTTNVDPTGLISTQVDSGSNSTILHVNQTSYTDAGTSFFGEF